MLIAQLDATVVAPKKKFLAAQAEAAEKKEQESSTPAKQSTGGAAAGAAAVAVKTEVKAEVKAEKGDVNSTSYSVRDNAPAGALADDSEEVLRFQNQQLYAALQVSPRSRASSFSLSLLLPLLLPSCSFRAVLCTRSYFGTTACFLGLIILLLVRVRGVA
eukprot:277558-Rhodomonas_salina.1